MIDERDSRTRLLGTAVVGLSGLLIASTALVFASPALVVGLLPGWLADPRLAHLTIRVVGSAVLLVIALCLVVIGRWAYNRLTGFPDRRTLAKGFVAAVVTAVWIISVLLPGVAANDPGLLAGAAPSVFADIAHIDTAMICSGLVSLGLPLLAALVAAVRYRARATAAILAFLTVVLVLPVATVVRHGSNRLQEERRNNRTECVYFVGGYDCPDK